MCLQLCFLDGFVPHAWRCKVKGFLCSAHIYNSSLQHRRSLFIEASCALVMFSNPPLDLNTLGSKEETEVQRGWDVRLLGLAGGPPLHVLELQCGRSPSLPNVELAQREELGGVSVQAELNPGWQRWGRRSLGKGSGSLGLPTMVSGMQGGVEAGVRKEQGSSACLCCYSHHSQGICPREVTAAAVASFHRNMIARHCERGSCCLFSVPSGGTGKVVSRPGQPVNSRQNREFGEEVKALPVQKENTEM